MKQDGTTEFDIVAERYDFANRIYVLKPVTTQIPTGTYKYTMMMDFGKGTIGFAKLNAEEDPHALIDGTNGVAYFAK